MAPPGAPPGRARSQVDLASAEALSNNLSQEVQQGFERLLQAYERLEERQERFMRNHFHGIEAEQDNIRSLVESQHAEMMHWLSLHDPGLVKSDQNMQPHEQHHHHLAISSNSQMSSGSDKRAFTESTHHHQQESVHRSNTPNDVREHKAPPEMLQRTLVGGLPTKKAGTQEEEEALDIHKLPLVWPTQSAEEKKAYLNDTSLGAIVRRFVISAKFDIIMSLCLLCNLGCMYMEMEWRSYSVKQLMGDRENDKGWGKVKEIFKYVEWAFSIVYLCELILRIFANGFAYFRSVVNVLDAFIVSATFCTTCFLRPMKIISESPKFAVGRLIMLSWVVRFLKVVRYAHACGELRVLARAFVSSLHALFWAIVVLIFIIISSGIFAFQFLVGYIEDENNPLETRIWAYNNFGSASTSIMSMWESTFTGAWHRFSRTMIMDISGYWANFWIFYVVFINFAVMRLIGALFLKQTLAVAASDAEKMTMIKLKEKQKLAEGIREVFLEADVDHNGKLSVKEFEQMLYDPRVGKYFASLELEVAEVATLFQLLAADDGVADYEEFLEGALKLTNSVKTVDVIQILHANQTLQKQVQIVYEAVRHFAQHRPNTNTGERQGQHSARHELHNEVADVFFGQESKLTPIEAPGGDVRHGEDDQQLHSHRSHRSTPEGLGIRENRGAREGKASSRRPQAAGGDAHAVLDPDCDRSDSRKGDALKVNQDKSHSHQRVLRERQAAAGGTRPAQGTMLRGLQDNAAVFVPRGLVDNAVTSTMINTVDTAVSTVQVGANKTSELAKAGAKAGFDGIQGSVEYVQDQVNQAEQYQQEVAMSSYAAPNLTIYK